MQNIPWKQWNGRKVERKEWKDVENTHKHVGKIMGNATENYSGDNERKNTEWKFGGSKVSRR